MLENPGPKPEYLVTGNVGSPFPAEPTQTEVTETLGRSVVPDALYNEAKAGISTGRKHLAQCRLLRTPTNAAG